MIAGIDEAGRGALAGPVVAACVIFLNKKKEYNQYKDSKKTNHQERLKLYSTLKNSDAIIVSSIINHKQIDQTNILEATMKAMSNCIKKLTIKPNTIIIDGNKKPLLKDYKIETCINGDNLIKEISAASIIAKVIRDKIMTKYHNYIPEFNFAKHKGYGTKKHYEELAQYGPSKIHRKTFNLHSQLKLF
tara:strand:- start:6658 stop:7224 length:567 start_codon:yes stop_codon:yes gene_type:complete